MSRILSNRIAVAGLLLALAAGTAAWSQVTIDPKEAGPDYAVQGEYQGKDGPALGCQVIALGDGQFRAVFLPGGLPGEGWDGKTRVQVNGKTSGEAAVFEAPDAGWSARLTDGKLTGKTGEGTEFSLARVVRHSKTEGLKPPAGAQVLFDGTNTDQWVSGRKTEDGLLMEGTQTKKPYRNFTLHLEFMTPFMPKARGQGRGNSGVFLDGRYEIQVLDSFGLTGENNECGGVYSIVKPLVNMCYPPITWQTYDIDFRAPEFENGTKTRSARVTVKHNGVLIHDNVEIPKSTAGGQEGPDPGPIQCMNHGNPVRFRNIWVVGE